MDFMMLFMLVGYISILVLIKMDSTDVLVMGIIGK